MTEHFRTDSKPWKNTNNMRYHIFFDCRILFCNLFLTQINHMPRHGEVLPFIIFSVLLQ